VLTAAAIGTDVFSPSFVEQGRALLFHSGRAKSSLMRLSLDDPAHPSVTTVLQDGATNYHAAPSPDGKWLAYDSDRDRTRAVYVAPVGGHEAIKVSGEGYAAIPRWSPDGSKLAFIKAEPRRPRVWNVWVANPDGTGLTRVSDHAVGEAWSASWFPGGTRLAYSVEDRLVIADLTLGTSRVIRSPRPGHLVRTPAVSPDGKWIVFQVHRDGAWLLQVGTGRMHRVLGDATAEEFAWSPDGRRVVYHTHRDGGWSLWQLAFGRSA
jgi:Tol biopolymer transport system component